MCAGSTTRNQAFIIAPYRKHLSIGALEEEVESGAPVGDPRRGGFVQENIPCLFFKTKKKNTKVYNHFKLAHKGYHIIVFLIYLISKKYKC